MVRRYAAARHGMSFWVLMAFLVGTLAFAVRAFVILHSGLYAVGGYDDGVYFTAAVNFVHGQLPYRDFLLLHPPGIVLALSPFALLAQWIGDPHAFAVARLAFALIGALNAALIVALLRRWGLTAALVGGVLYAVSFAAVYGERTTTLEPLGVTFMLMSLLALRHAQTMASRRWFVLAGVLGAAAVAMKLWFIVPLVVIFLVARGGRLRYLLGVLLSALVIFGPFFAAAPGNAWRDMVSAQLGRLGDSHYRPASRLRYIVNFDWLANNGHLTGVWLHLGLGVILLLGLVVAFLCMRQAETRVYVYLSIACGLMLMASPSFFRHYTILTVAPLALMAGAGLGQLRVRWLRVLAGIVAILLACVLGAPQAMQRYGTVPPLVSLAKAVATVPGCIATDDPTILIVTDRLSKQVAAGCKTAADPSGYGYVLVGADGHQLRRSSNPAFQRWAQGYFEQADGFIRVRGGSYGLDNVTRDAVDAYPTVFKQGRWVLHRTP